MFLANAALPRTAAPVRPTQTVTDFADQFRALVGDGYLWLSQNSVRVAIAAVAGTLIVLALLGLKMLGQRLCRDRAVPDLRTVVGRVIGRTGFWFMVILAAELVIGYANTPPAIDQTVHFCWVVAFAFQAAIWARELILGVVEHRAGVGEAEHGGLGSALGIIRVIVTFSLFALAIILILDNLGVNVTGLIAGLGIGGIAIGLAAKGIFDDLFAALAILFDKPFRRGDSVRWDQTSGTVEGIGLKSTRIRSISGEQVIISNANLLNKELHNLARLDRRRMTLSIGVTYETPQEKCRVLPAMLREIIEGVDKCVVVRCGLINFGASSLDYEVQFDVRSENYNEVYDARTEVCLRILERLNAEGIAFAYPTQTTFTAAPNGRLVMPYPKAVPDARNG